MKTYAIYITDNLIRFAQTAISRKGQADIKEDQINIASLSTEGIVSALKKFLKQNRISPDYLTLGIPRTKASIRYLDLPSVDESEIRKMVEHQLNNLFPYKTEELVFDHALIQKNPNGYSNIMVVAVQRKTILQQLLLLKQAGLVPQAIELSSVSLFHQFIAQNRAPANYLLINLDDCFMDIIHISEGRLVFSRGVDFNAPFDKEKLLQALNLTVTIIKGKGYKIDKVLLSAKGLDLEDFARSLEEATTYEVEIDETLSVIKGLVLKNDGSLLKINLLPEEFKIQKKKELSIRSLFYFISLLLLNLSLIANIVFLKMKSRDEYLYLLQSEVKKLDTYTAVLQKNMLKAQVFQNYQNLSRTTLGLLSDLYLLAPEGIYLNSLNISSKNPSGTMVIIGQAQDSEAVLKFANALKKSSYINKTDINYITKKSLPPQQIPAQEMVEFKISATL